MFFSALPSQQGFFMQKTQQQPIRATLPQKNKKHLPKNIPQLQRNIPQLPKNIPQLQRNISQLQRNI